MVYETDTDKNKPKEPRIHFFCYRFYPPRSLAAVAAKNKRSPAFSSKARARVSRAHVSRKLSSPGRRKGTPQGPGGIQARAGREVCAEILHHQPGWQCCSSLSVRGVGAIERKLAQLSNYNPTKKKFLAHTNYYGQVVEIDAQGRLLLPQMLRDSARLRRSGGLGQADLFGSSDDGRARKEIRSKLSPMRTTRASTNWASSGHGFGFKTPPSGAGVERNKFGHVPVLLQEAIDFLAIRRGGTYIDATLGLAGHSYEIARRLGAEGRLIGFDKDSAALGIARRHLGPVAVRVKARTRRLAADPRLALRSR